MLPRRSLTAPLKILSLSMLVSCSTSEISGPQPSDEDSDALRQATSLSGKLREQREHSGQLSHQAAKLLLAESDLNARAS